MARLVLFMVATFTTVMMFLGGLALALVSPVQITNDPADQGRPDVQEDIIVWKDFRNGNWDIYMYDLSVHAEIPISTHPAYQNMPITNGSTIIWQDNRNGDWDLYMKDASGGEEQPLVWGPGNKGLPTVSGSLVTYVDDSSGSNDIYAIDLVSREIIPISTNPANQWQPRISGTKIVWQDDRNGRWDLYMHDVSTGVEEQVTDNPGNDKVADIDRDRVVWQRENDGVSNIWMKDLDSGTEEAITDDANFQNSPRISGDLVVWEEWDHGAGQWDIMMKDLTSGMTGAVAAGPSTQVLPAIDRETVVWEATSPISYDIWMAYIADTVPPEVTETSPADGSHAGCSRPTISAVFSDNRAGIDPGGITLELDGEDVTGGAVISEAGISYQPPGPVSDGPHSVTLTVSDKSGNTTNVDWEFSTEKPELSLSLLNSFWASYGDFSARELSVSFQLLNRSASDAIEFEVIAVQASTGVTLWTETPLIVGSIPAGSSREEVLVYKLASGISSFKTTLFAGYEDACGSSFLVPHPPPEM
ncbi:MAG: hypothetical protein IBX61_02580 [Thermoleophilia bacterium]|nr:hypothetical protein [Thermoleophilia bacterium]